MPISVNLIELISIWNTQPLWPSEFVAFMNAINADPEERNNYAVCADWLHEQGELLLEQAFRHVEKRKNMKPDRVIDNWYICGMSAVLRHAEHNNRVTLGTAAGVMADLAYRLQKAKDELE